ncbi:hypothetical protein GQX74_002050 [Glossina fuscipes]|nr:hypothetical protein GQX74_002050 [Glossina fuscipes]
MVTPAKSKLGQDNKKQLVKAVAIVVAIKHRRMILPQDRSNFFTKYPPKNVPPPPVGIKVPMVIQQLSSYNVISIVSSRVLVTLAFEYRILIEHWLSEHWLLTYSNDNSCLAKTTIC